MKSLNALEAAAWMRDRGIEPSNDCVGRAPEQLIKRLPSDSGKKSALSRVLASVFRGDSDVMFWITEYGIWPSTENRHLFDAYRRGIGILEPIEERPAQLINKGETPVLEALILLTTCFSWGALVASADACSTLQLSHDDFFRICFRSVEERAAAQREIDSIVDSS